MAEFRWIITSSLLLFSFREAAGQDFSFAVRVGDDVTLPCERVIQDQEKCDTSTWVSSGVTLVERGQIHKDAKSDRLRVTEKCSLVIKKVTREDAGFYTCRQIRSGQAVHVDLTVVSMTEQKSGDTVNLWCSVWTHSGCGHTVKWLHEGNYFTDVETSRSDCSAWVFTMFRLKQKYHELLKCEVKNVNTGKVQLFPFSPPQSSGDNAATTRRNPAMKRTITTPTTTTSKSPLTRNKSVKMSKTTETNNTTSKNNNGGTKQQGWWRLVYVPAGLAALIITVVAVNMWTRTQGNKTQMEENIERNDEDEDKDEGTVNYENAGEPSASVRLH